MIDKPFTLAIISEGGGVRLAMNLLLTGMQFTRFTTGEFGDLQRGISVWHTRLEQNARSSFARLVPL